MLRVLGVFRCESSRLPALGDFFDSCRPLGPTNLAVAATSIEYSFYGLVLRYITATVGNLDCISLLLKLTDLSIVLS